MHPSDAAGTKSVTTMTSITLKRAYEPATKADGYRVYIDRLWPRGLSHETFHYDVWDKEVAPSDELRHWFHDNPDARWEDFETSYSKELAANPAWAAFVDSLSRHPVVTLLFSSRNETENNAIVVARELVAKAPDRFELAAAD